MKLSTKTRYGVRAMFDIAYHTPRPLAAGQTEVAAQAKDIAKRQDIPLRYLEQIFQDLKRSGLVDSKRGPRGGYTLKSAPSDITLADIVVAIQGPIEELFSPNDDSLGSENGEGGAAICSRHVTHAVWRELADHVTSWLADVTLADLTTRASKLGLPRAGAGQPMYFI